MMTQKKLTSLEKDFIVRVPKRTGTSYHARPHSEAPLSVGREDWEKARPRNVPVIATGRKGRGRVNSFD